MSTLTSSEINKELYIEIKSSNFFGAESNKLIKVKNFRVEDSRLVLVPEHNLFTIVPDGK